MPCLGDWMGGDVGVMIYASWVVRRPHLDSMVLEERMVKCRLFGDMHTVDDISIWALNGCESRLIEPPEEALHLLPPLSQTPSSRRRRRRPAVQAEKRESHD